MARLVIRTAYCKAADERFSLLPDFLIPRRRISRLSHQAFTAAFQLHRQRLTDAIDELIAGLGDEFYLPRSTAHSYLHPKFAVPPCGASRPP